MGVQLAHVSHWRDDGTCSYCGSLSPERFFAAIAEGAQLGPTDKDYKVYVGGHQKFYFQHLDADERKRFVKMINAKTLNIDYPGYFYVLPFFAVRVDRTS